MRGNDNHSISAIGIILSVYKMDTVEFFRQAVDSIMSQSIGNVELYIGVDGPVGTQLEQYIKSIEGQPRITIVWFPENRGLARVLNDLLDICFQNGHEYIGRMDADDVSLPDRLEKQLRFMQSNPDIDVVGGSIAEINEYGQSRNKVIVYPETPAACRAFFARRNPHTHPTVLFRKRFFEKAGCKYRPEYRRNQDTMLWFDGMMKGTQHANVPDVVLNYRITESFFKKRRNGWAFAAKQLKDRMMINRGLHYGAGAYLYGLAMFCLLVSPVWVKKIAYRVFR